MSEADHCVLNKTERTYKTHIRELNVEVLNAFKKILAILCVSASSLVKFSKPVSLRIDPFIKPKFCYRETPERRMQREIHRYSSPGNPFGQAPSPIPRFSVSLKFNLNKELG
jgi:hypothetical protein